MIRDGIRDAEEQGGFPATGDTSFYIESLLPCGSSVCVCVCLVAQLCPTLYDPMDYSPPGSSVHGDSPGKNTGVGYMPSSRSSSQLKDRNQVSHIAGRFFTV